MTTKLVTGNTYPHRLALRKLGGTWDPEAKGWRVPEEKVAEAEALVGSSSPVKPAAAPAKRTVPRGWRPCGYPGCTPTYCDECDGKGAGRHSYY
jgi:hypothetical protein